MSLHPYKFVKISTSGTPYVNTSSHWAVLAGLDFNGISPAGDSMTVKDASGVILDGVFVQTYGTAASETMIFLPRRMLVPPGGSITTSIGVGGTLIVCGDDDSSIEESLALALRIL